MCFTILNYGGWLVGIVRPIPIVSCTNEQVKGGWLATLSTLPGSVPGIIMCINIIWHSICVYINITYETKGCVYYVRIFFNLKKFTLLHSICIILSHFACSGHPDLFNYAQTSVFNVKYLGHLKNVSPQSGRLSSAENQTVTLEAIDTAQVYKQHALVAAQTACIYYTVIVAQCQYKN